MLDELPRYEGTKDSAEVDHPGGTVDSLPWQARPETRCGADGGTTHQIGSSQGDTASHNRCHWLDEFREKAPGVTLHAVQPSEVRISVRKMSLRQERGIIYYLMNRGSDAARSLHFDLACTIVTQRGRWPLEEPGGDPNHVPRILFLTANTLTFSCPVRSGDARGLLHHAARIAALAP